MANGLFRLSPSEAIAEGVKQISYAGEFNRLKTDLFKTVDELLATGYTSPAARFIHSKIRGKEHVIDGVVKTLNNYGTYLTKSGKDTADTDDSVAAGVKIKG